MFRILPDNLKFDGFTLVTGFHGIGVTGYWSIKYMIQNIDLNNGSRDLLKLR